MLSVIAIVPLIGAGWFAVGEVLRASAERDRVGQVDASVGDLVALSELRTRLLDEQNWTSAEIGIFQLGLSPALVSTMTGIDVPEQARRSSARVDALLDQLGLVDVETEVDDIRSSDQRPLTETGQRYVEVEGVVAGLSEEQFDELLDGAGGLADRGDLVDALRVLEAATIARQSISAEFNHYFSAQFSDVADRSDEIEGLVGQSAIRQAAMAEIGRLAEPQSSSRIVFDEIRASGAASAFDLAVGVLVAQQLDGQGAETAALATVLTDLGEVASTFQDSSVTTALYFDLVQAAGDDVYRATAEANIAAATRNRMAVGVLLALVSVSFTVAVAATRAIARPIQGLARAAERIRDGHSTDAIVLETGPEEVREASRALNEAGSQLALAERQALALAQGDLQHQSLSESIDSSLGASLHTAVQRLASSMQEREEFRQRMTHEATHDGLTQLPNRNASLKQLAKSVARTGLAGTRLGVLFIDLDGFKEVNDHHGHSAGDIVLRATAKRLTAVVRAGDHVGRLGGDEFVVLVEPVANQGELEAFADAIRAALCQPIELESGSASIGASIGVSMTGPESGHQTPTDLLRDADLAVYRAKELGRNRIVICDDELRSTAAELADLEDALRGALMDDEFVLYYQPIVEPVARTVVGYEALIRWDRPGHGLVGPDEFIPFAERSDLIVRIDQWVVEAVARQIVAWDAEGLFTDTPISINISGRHLASNHFISNVMGPLDALGIEPSRVVVEITESALLDDLTSAALKLQQLRTRGVRTAIDDFGTGYTSLAHLKTLPIDILKIDRTFTSDPSAASLVQLIIDTGHLLGATVTAEGIETSCQAATLNDMGSDDLQGYLYGRPVPPGELTRGADVVTG